MMSAISRSAPYHNNSKLVTNDLCRVAACNRAMILFLLDTGVRVGELVTALKEKLDIKVGSVKVIGRDNKERVVYFSPTTAMALWKYSQSHESSFLFGTELGRKLDRNNVAHALPRLCQRAGVPVYSPHAFRHTFAVNYLRNYPNIYALQQMLGLSSLDVVKRYFVISEQDLQPVHMQSSPVEKWNL